MMIYDTVCDEVNDRLIDLEFEALEGDKGALRLVVNALRDYRKTCCNIANGYVDPKVELYAMCSKLLKELEK